MSKEQCPCGRKCKLQGGWSYYMLPNCEFAVTFQQYSWNCCNPYDSQIVSIHDTENEAKEAFKWHKNFKPSKLSKGYGFR